MFKKLAHAGLATALGASMLLMPTEASAITVPAPQKNTAAGFNQQGDLLQNVQYQRRRWLRARDGRYVGRSRAGSWRGFNSPRSRYLSRSRAGYSRGFINPRNRYYNRRAWNRAGFGYPRYYRGGYGYPRYYRGYGYPYRYGYYNRWDRGAGWLLAAPFAFAAGAALASPNYYSGYGYRGYRGSSHVRWCASRYRSYSPRTNTWVGYSGRVYQCDSPYDRR